MKVETTGDFMLIDPYNGQEIEAFGPTNDIIETPFILRAVEDGQLVNLGENKPEPVSDGSAPNSGKATRTGK